MITKTIYECSYCKKTFDNESDCVACENKHIEDLNKKQDKEKRQNEVKDAYAKFNELSKKYQDDYDEYVISYKSDNGNKVFFGNSFFGRKNIITNPSIEQEFDSTSTSTKRGNSSLSSLLDEFESFFM